MFDQATIDGRAARGTSAPPVSDEPRSRVGELLHDLTELSELQARLFAADARDMWAGSKIAIIGILTSVVLALGSIPVALAGLSYAVSESSGLSNAASFLIVAVVAGLIPAGLLVWLSLKKMQSALGTMQRSTNEFSRNLAWFKTTLKRKS